MDLVSVDGKVDQEPSCNLAHVVHATLRLYGFTWEVIRLGFQIHPHGLGERDVNGDPPLHIACASGPYLSAERQRKECAKRYWEFYLHPWGYHYSTQHEWEATTHNFGSVWGKMVWRSCANVVHTCVRTQKNHNSNGLCMTGEVHGTLSVRNMVRCVAVHRTNWRQDRHMEDSLTFGKKYSQMRIRSENDLKTGTAHRMPLHHP